MLNGLNAPAWLSVVPAVNDGLKFWPQLDPIVNSLDGSAGALPLHGVSCEVAAYVPHSDGVSSAARGPPNRSSLISLSGSCGMLSNASAICPVLGSSVALPPSLISTPPPSTTTYSPISDSSNVSGCARYTAPFNGCSSSGVSTSASPSLDEFGHDDGFSLCSSISLEVHAPNPFAAASEMAIPGGSVTTIRSGSAPARPFALSSRGIFRSTFSPVGDSAVAASGAGFTSSDGLKSRFSQPVTGGDVAGSGSMPSGSCHELTLIVVSSALPVQTPGMVNSGVSDSSTGQSKRYSFAILPCSI